MYTIEPEIKKMQMWSKTWVGTKAKKLSINPYKNKKTQTTLLFMRKKKHAFRNAII